jgi:hypothetical protein
VLVEDDNVFASGQACAVKALTDAIKRALDTVTEADIRGWFTHSGYSIQ